LSQPGRVICAGGREQRGTEREAKSGDGGSRGSPLAMTHGSLYRPRRASDPTERLINHISPAPGFPVRVQPNFMTLIG